MVNVTCEQPLRVYESPCDKKTVDSNHNCNVIKRKDTKVIKIAFMKFAHACVGHAQLTHDNCLTVAKKIFEK